MTTLDEIDGEIANGKLGINEVTDQPQIDKILDEDKLEDKSEEIIQSQGKSKKNIKEIAQSLDKFREVIRSQNDETENVEQTLQKNNEEDKSVEIVNNKNGDQPDQNQSTETIPIVTIKVEPEDDGYPVIDPSQYRIKIEPESEDDESSTETSSSSSSESETEEEKNKKNQRSRKTSGSSQTEKQKVFNKDDIRTKGELFPEELPPIEDLTITVDETVDLVHIGEVTSVVGVLAIVQANENMPPLNEETIIFLEGRVSCGKIFEVFGPVASPWYSLRFNSTDDIKEKGVTLGTKMYCAPKVDEYTNYVFVEHLKQIKGSDASWEDNNEPPEKFLDFSDDESERKAKAKKKEKKLQENLVEEGHLPGAKQRRRNADVNSSQQNETNNFRQTSTNNRSNNRTRGFAPFGGKPNKFQPRGPHSQNSTQGVPRPQLNYSGGIQPASFQENNTQYVQQPQYGNTGTPYGNFLPQNQQPVIPNLAEPPPSFGWNNGFNSQNYSTPEQSNNFNQFTPMSSVNSTVQSGQSSTSYSYNGVVNSGTLQNGNSSQFVDNTHSNFYNTTGQNNLHPYSTNCSSGQNFNFNNGSIFASQGSQSNNSAPFPYQSQEFNGTGQGYMDNNGHTNQNTGNSNQQGQFYNPTNGKGPIIDNRLIQNSSYQQQTVSQPNQQPVCTFPPNQPLFSHPPSQYANQQQQFRGQQNRPPFQPNRPRFGGQPQFTRFNQPY